MFNYQWEDSEFAESSRKSLEEAENMKESSWRTWGGEKNKSVLPCAEFIRVK